MLPLSRMGFGVTGKLDRSIIRELAPIVEQAGFGTLWFNHIPNGNAFEAIDVAASVTSRIGFATGVTPVDTHSAEWIVSTVRQRDLPLDRLTLGVGASRTSSPLTTVKEAVDYVRSELGVSVVVGALGPKMRRLGVLDADGVLLNWLTPEAAKLAMADAEHDQEGKDGALRALYIRSAVEDAALEPLIAEADRYEGFASYAANFRRLGFRAMDAAIFATEPGEFQRRLMVYADIVDQAIIRTVAAEETTAAYVRIVEAAVAET